MATGWQSFGRECSMPAPRARSRSEACSGRSLFSGRFCCLFDTSKDAIDLIAARYPAEPAPAREAFEWDVMAVEFPRASESGRGQATLPVADFPYDWFRASGQPRGTRSSAKCAACQQQAGVQSASLRSQDDARRRLRSSLVAPGGRR